MPGRHWNRSRSSTPSRRRLAATRFRAPRSWRGIRRRRGSGIPINGMPVSRDVPKRLVIPMRARSSRLDWLLDCAVLVGCRTESQGRLADAREHGDAVV
jgi:hypothetical protein